MRAARRAAARRSARGDGGAILAHGSADAGGHGDGGQGRYPLYEEGEHPRGTDPDGAREDGGSDTPPDAGASDARAGEPPTARLPTARGEAAELDPRRLGLVDGLNVIVWDGDPETLRFRFVNRYAEEVLGYRRERWLAEPDFWFEHLHPQDRDRIVADFRAATEQGRDQDVEYRMVAADGRIVWLRTLVRLIRDEAGRPQRLCGVMVDITEQKHAQEALRTSRRRLWEQNQVLLRLAERQIREPADLPAALREITEAAVRVLGVERAGIWTFDDGRSRIRLIEQFDRSTESHAEGLEFARADFPAYFAELDRERTLAAQDARVDPRTREFTEIYLVPRGITSMLDAPIRSGGELRGVVCLEHVGPPRTWTPEDESFAGSIADMVALAMEAAERSRAEQSLHLLAEVGAVLAASLDYRTTLGNVARLAIPGFADACLVDVVEEGQIRRVAATAADPAKQALIDELRRRHPLRWDSRRPAAVAIRTGKPELITESTDAMLLARVDDPDEVRLLRALGVRSVIAQPLVARGEPLGAITFASAGRGYGPDDLPLAEELARRAALAIDNARVHEAALAASKAKSDFLAVMSHELRTPLTAIIGYADLLAAETAGPLTARQKEQLSYITRRARDLIRIIEQILAYSRMEAGRATVHLEPVDLAELVRAVAEIAAPLAGERHLAFHIVAPEEPTIVVTDRGKLRRILLDLLSNAVKFTDRGSVALEADVEDAWIVAHVRDTGIGIRPEDQERIFEPFVQVEAALTRERGGTGLGLTVARRLARLLGGEITVQSEPGKGSTFTARLPARRGEAAEG
ncbi:MAG: GAF domain-containing protein [Gemmatimonadetes bacterium]|nr:GAF domain-containing protein [Gemmatimonadota bacterium]